MIHADFGLAQSPQGPIGTDDLGVDETPTGRIDHDETSCHQKGTPGPAA